MIINDEDYGKVIVLLDKAIKLDSSYAPAFANKFSCQMSLKQYKKALTTAKILNRIDPKSSTYFIATGMVYEILGDTTHSKICFSEAASYFSKTLDTMSTKNKLYDGVRINKAINLILLGQKQQSNQLLEQISDENKGDYTGEIISHFMHKSKKQIISGFTESGSIEQPE